MRKKLIPGTIWAVLTACGLMGQNWQNSWEAFAREIAPYPARSENAFDPELKAKFEGKQVTWEGTVSKNAQYSEDRAFVLEVTPMDFRIVSAMAVGGGGTGKVSTLQVRPKKGSLNAWKKTTPGSKVKFRGLLKEPIYMVLAFNGGVHLILNVQDAEPALSGDAK